MDRPLDRRLDLAGAAVVTVLCLSWGFGQVTVKWAYLDVSPLLSGAIRSLLALACLVLYGRLRGQPLAWPEGTWGHRLLLAGLVTAQFIVIYIGLDLTLASRGAVLIYIQPFVTAILAHLLLPQDRLNGWRGAGLVLAFGGLAMVLLGRPATGQASLLGDLLCLAGGCIWGVLTVYIRHFLLGRVTMFQVVTWQFVFTIPALVVASLILEPAYFNPTWRLAGSLLYQGVVVAGVTFLIWYKLFERYQVTTLGAATFLAPIFGVLLSGLVLGEPLTLNLALGLSAVSVGVGLVNKA